jgi:hypothetical protein
VRAIRRITSLLIAGAVAAGVAVLASFQILGVGSFDQPVVLESTKPIQRVTYCTLWLDDATRQRAEATADPTSFDCREASVEPGNRFMAKVKFTSRSGLFRSKTLYPPQLVVFVDLAGGHRECRVVDLPSGCGNQEVVISLR